METYAKEFVAFMSALASGFIVGLWRKLQQLEQKIDRVEADIIKRIDKKEENLQSKIVHLHETKVSREELKMVMESIHNDLADIKRLLSKALGG